MSAPPSSDVDSVLVRALLRKIERAKDDPAAFFEFVMREETTRARIQTMPHQRLVFEFIEANPLCVIRMPIGTSKTYMMVALSLYFLGKDPTSRGAIVSATEEQAAKVLGAARDYIESSQELRAVFPELRPSQRTADPWQQTKITVDRPAGIRDPSLRAVGIDTKLPGSRLSWVVVDDILSLDNTATPHLRAQGHRAFEANVLSRLDPKGARLCVTNTPWVAPSSSDPGDLTYVLEAAGWPTLTVSAFGEIKITNAPDFDSDEIRPSEGSVGPEDPHRLAAHDTPEYLALVYGDAPPPNPALDEEEIVPLWPERYSLEYLEQKRREFRPREFAQLFESKARSEADDRLKEEWIIAAKAEGRKLGFHRFGAAPPPGAIAIATGVDLAVGKKKRNDRSAIVTIAVLPDRRRVVLDIEVGRFGGLDIVNKVIAKHDLFGSIARVENNAAQDFLLQWIRATDKSVPIRAHTTGKNKADPRHGVESLFIEIEQGAWIFPCGLDGRSPGSLDELLQDLRQYEPDVHTGDVLMALWFAREQARKQGAFSAARGRENLHGISSR